MRLRHLAAINPPTPEFDALAEDAELPFIPLEAVWPNRRLDVTQRRTKAAVATGYTRFREGDILVPKITPTFQADRTAIATPIEGNVAAGTTELHIVRPGPDIDRRYARYLLSSKEFLDLGEASMIGVAGQKRVPDVCLRDLEVPLADQDEQRRVADFLDAETARIDALIAKKHKLRDLWRERFWAYAGALLWSDAIPRVPLRRAAASLSVGVVVNPSTYVSPNGTIPYIRGTDISAMRINIAKAERMERDVSASLSKSQIGPGDVLMVRVGDPGVSAVVPPDVPIANCASVLIIRPSARTDSPFLAFALNSPRGRGSIRALSVGAAQAQLNVSAAADLRIPQPRLADQVAISHQLEVRWAQQRSMAQKLDRQIELLNEHRQALITAAVTGQHAVAL